jgi:hypothetical protein
MPEPCPPVDVLRRVNCRSFAAGLGATLPGAAFVTTSDVAEAMLAAPPPVGAAWRVKHAFGMAGRNQRVIAPASTDRVDRTFVAAGLRRDGVQIEPNVVVVEEYGRHAALSEGGSLRVGALVRQWCDARGAWVATERVSDPASAPLDVARRLGSEIERVGAALHAAGYFGPFGIDAYTYRDAKNALALQPRSEINARYSMGFAIGFGPA